MKNPRYHELVLIYTVVVNRHSAGSQHAIILARWLGGRDPALLASMITSGPSSFDWMLLALAQLSNQEQNKNIGQEFVRRLLARGDIHASVAVLLGLGDHIDAIEVYVSRDRYLEAILLTCLTMPLEWQRQSYLVRKWGEHVVQNSQQHLALRCFSCTDTDPSETWPFAAAQMTSLISSQLPSKYNSPEPDSASRSAPKHNSLKLITSFSPSPNPAFKFPGLWSADRTPTNAAAITPIAESAGVESATRSPGSGYHRQNGSRSMSGRTTTPVGFSKQRLSSIGETPVDVASPKFPPPRRPSAPEESGSEKDKNASVSDSQKETVEGSADTLFLSSARYDPSIESSKGTPKTAIEAPAVDRWAEKMPLSSTADNSSAEKHHARNASRDRKPEGLQIQWPPAEVSPAQRSDYESTDSASATRRSILNVVSPAMTTDSNRSTKSGAASVRSIDQHISSLDEANYYSRNQHVARRERRNTDTDSPKEGNHKKSSRGSSKDSRGRSNQRYIQPAKRSPSSPIPMSPEDIALYASLPDRNELTSNTGSGMRSKSRSRSQKGKQRARTPSKSKFENRGRSRSASRPVEAVPDRASSRSAMRRTSPEPADPHKNQTGSRGRSRHREKSSGFRSPSSPLPMSPPQREENREVEDSLRLVNENRRRLRSQQRSLSRRPERGTSSRRDPSPDRRRNRERSHSRPSREEEPGTGQETLLSSERFYKGHKYGYSADNVRTEWMNTRIDHNLGQSPIQDSSERSRKELAAAELEARRLSLARRPSAPTIPLPGEFQTTSSPRSRQGDSPLNSGKSFSQRIAGKSTVSPASSNYSDSSGRGPSIPVGLPATPRAMRHPKYSTGYTNHEVPSVPDIPNGISPTSEKPTHNGVQVPGRSMSVPPTEELVNGLPAHPLFHRQIPGSRISNHTPGQDGPSDFGKASPQAHRSGITVDLTLDTSQGNATAPPPLLPELQHLQAPPPPPPPPAPPETLSASNDERSSLGSGVGTINIAIDDHIGTGPSMRDVDGVQRSTTAPASTTEPTSPPRRSSAGPFHDPRRESSHRRGSSVNENITNKIRSLTDRMRSNSRGPNSRSPPNDGAERQSPYESVSINHVIDNKL